MVFSQKLIYAFSKRTRAKIQQSRSIRSVKFQLSPKEWRTEWEYPFNWNSVLSCIYTFIEANSETANSLRHSIYRTTPSLLDFLVARLKGARFRMLIYSISSMKRFHEKSGADSRPRVLDVFRNRARQLGAVLPRLITRGQNRAGGSHGVVTHENRMVFVRGDDG